MATFSPLLMGPGTSGQIQAVIATVVLCCLIFSLIESQLILPSHLGHQSADSPTAEVGLLMIPIILILLLKFSWDFRSFAAGDASLYEFFQPRGRAIDRITSTLCKNLRVNFRGLAAGAIANRYITASIALVALLSCVGGLGSGRLPFSFFLPLASDRVIAQLTMPLGTPASVTTFVGLAPLLINRDVQTQLSVPMAISLAFGVILATLVTLLVVPSGYMILEDLKGKKPSEPASSWQLEILHLKVATAVLIDSNLK